MMETIQLRTRRGKLEYRFRVKGRRVSKVTGWEDTERNRKKALKEALQHRDDIVAGDLPVYRIPTRMFQDAAKEFVAHARIEHADRPATVRRVETSLASLNVFFRNRPIAAIGLPDVKRYMTWRLTNRQEGGEIITAVKPITLRHDLDNLSKFFQWAVSMQLAKENPIRRGVEEKKLKKPSDQDAVRMHILTPAEEFLYFHHAANNPNLHDVAQLILQQGMRPEEAMSLRKEHVDLARRTLRIPKGKTKASRRILELTPDSVSILASRMDGPSPWIFPSPKRPGKPITKLNGVHDRICEKHKLNFVIYDLRHTFATRYSEHTNDLASLAAILGHSSIRIVTRYVHPTQATQRAGMNKLYATQSAILTEAKREFETKLKGAGLQRTPNGPQAKRKNEDLSGFDGIEQEVVN